LCSNRCILESGLSSRIQKVPRIGGLTLNLLENRLSKPRLLNSTHLIFVIEAEGLVLFLSVQQRPGSATFYVEQEQIPYHISCLKC